MPGTPKAGTPPLSPQLIPQGPSQLLTALLVRLSDATNRALIDQAAIDFAFLNSKAARKRLTKVRICYKFMLITMLPISMSVSKSSRQESNRLTTTLFKASGYSSQIYARCWERPCRYREYILPYCWGWCTKAFSASRGIQIFAEKEECCQGVIRSPTQGILVPIKVSGLANNFESEH